MREVDLSQRLDLGIDEEIDVETRVGEAQVDLRSLEQQPVVGVCPQVPEPEVNDDAPWREVLDADSALDHAHQQDRIKVVGGQVAGDPLVSPGAKGADYRVKPLASLGQPVLVAVSIKGRLSPGDARSLKCGQPFREEAGRDPRQSAPQVVEVSGSAQELADDERRPALSEELGPSRDRAELPVSAHAQSFAQIDPSSKFEIWTGAFSEAGTFSCDD